MRGDSPPVQGHFLPAFSALTFSVPHSHCSPHAQRRAAVRGGVEGPVYVNSRDSYNRLTQRTRNAPRITDAVTMTAATRSLLSVHKRQHSLGSSR